MASGFQVLPVEKDFIQPIGVSLSVFVHPFGRWSSAGVRLSSVSLLWMNFRVLVTIRLLIDILPFFPFDKPDFLHRNPFILGFDLCQSIGLILLLRSPGRLTGFPCGSFWTILNKGFGDAGFSCTSDCPFLRLSPHSLEALSLPLVDVSFDILSAVFRTVERISFAFWVSFDVLWSDLFASIGHLYSIVWGLFPTCRLEIPEVFLHVKRQDFYFSFFI